LLSVSMLRFIGSDLRNKSFNDGTYYWWTIEIMRMMVTVPHFNEVDRAMLSGLGASKEQLGNLETFCGGTYIFESCAKGAPVAEIRYAATLRTIVGTTLGYMARTMCGAQADDCHYAAFAVTEAESLLGNRNGCYLRDTPMGVAELRRQFGEGMAEALKDCQGLPSAGLDVWDLTGSVVGVEYKEDQNEMWRQKGMYIEMCGRICMGVSVPRGGPKRLHELKIDKNRGMKQPAQAVVVRRRRRLYAQLLYGSVAEQAHRMPSNDKVAISLVGVKMAEDLGVFEPHDHLTKFSPGSMAADTTTNKRYFLLCPHQNEHTVAEVMNENFHIRFWVGIEVQRDRQGWDKIDLHDASKCLRLDTTHMRLNFTGYHLSKIFEAAEGSPLYVDHADGYRAALLAAKKTVGHCDTETMQQQFSKAKLARAFAVNRTPLSVKFKKKMAALRGDPSCD
jgi:hypothetical protein